MNKKKDKGVPVSPKHGVNPTLVTCFWCGKQTGEIALLGKLKGDAEAPRETCLGIEPCDACKAKMNQGVTLIEVCDDGSRFGENPRFAFSDLDGTRCWPTGRFAVVNASAAFVRKYKKGQRVLCGKETMNAVLGAATRTEVRNEEIRQ